MQYLFSSAVFLRICSGLDNCICFSIKIDTVDMTTWRFFFPEESKPLDANHLGMDVLPGVERVL